MNMTHLIQLCFPLVVDCCCVESIDCVVEPEEVGPIQKAKEEIVADAVWVTRRKSSVRRCRYPWCFPQHVSSLLPSSRNGHLRSRPELHTTRRCDCEGPNPPERTHKLCPSRLTKPFAGTNTLLFRKTTPFITTIHLWLVSMSCLSNPTTVSQSGAVELEIRRHRGW